MNLYNKQNYTICPQWDVIGIVNGTINDEVIVLGNHRDAWIAGGAGDPNSGSAALNEVIRSFGVALSRGWKPLRTIVFASWDGEEYGLIGSTEWVEEFQTWLNATVIAYLNVDIGTSGPHFSASASPLLNRAIYNVTKTVLSPNQTVPGSTVYDLWDKKITTMGSGSDFTAFQDYVGIPSVDMGFSNSKSSAVYHYHSNYDSFHWMDTYGDPGWHYHVTIARVWALMAAYLSESSIIPLNVTDYSTALSKYLDDARNKMHNDSAALASFESYQSAQDPSFSSEHKKADPFAMLQTHVANLTSSARTFDNQAAILADELMLNPLPWWRWWERLKLYYKVRSVNSRYKLFERQFVPTPPN